MVYNETLQNGSATFNLGKIEAGNYTANINYKGNNIYLPSSTSCNINVMKYNTQLLVNDQSNFTDTLLTLQATLQYSDENNIIHILTNNSVEFYEGEKLIGTAITDDNGVASLDYTITSSSTIITVKFNSTEKYNSCENQFTVKGNPKIITSLTFVENDIFYYQNQSSLQVILSTGSIETLLCYIDDVRQNDLITDDTGTATISFNNLELGIHHIKVIFRGNKQYEKCSSTKEIEVITQIETHIINWSYPESFIYDIPQTISACLDFEEEGVPIDIFIDDEHFGILQTDKNGLFTVTIPEFTIGNHTFKAVYKGNTYYKGCESSITFTARDKLDSVMDISSVDSEIVYTQPLTISGSILGVYGGQIQILNGTDILNTCVTDNKGQFNTNISLDIGNYNLTVKFVGNTSYKECSTNITVNVIDKYIPKFGYWDVPSNLTILNEYTLGFTLYNQRPDIHNFNDPRRRVGNEPVKVYVDDILLTTIITQELGNQNFTYIPADVKSHNIKVVYEGNDIYNSCEATIPLTATSRKTSATLSSTNWLFVNNPASTTTITPTFENNSMTSGLKVFNYWTEKILRKNGNWTLTLTVQHKDTKKFQYAIMTNPNGSKHTCFSYSISKDGIIYLWGDEHKTLTSTVELSTTKQSTLKIVKNNDKMSLYINDTIVGEPVTVTLTEDVYFMFTNWSSSQFILYNINLEEFS